MSTTERKKRKRGTAGDTERTDKDSDNQATHGTIETGDERERPRCHEIAAEGIRTGSDFAAMMSALMSDIIEGRVTPQVGNATVNAGGKLLKIVELQLKYGTCNDKGGKTLNLLESPRD